MNNRFLISKKFSFLIFFKNFFQLEQQLNQNKDLNDQVRNTKLESNTLQRSLNDYQLASRERDRLQAIVTESEV